MALLKSEHTRVNELNSSLQSQLELTVKKNEELSARIKEQFKSMDELTKQNSQLNDTLRQLTTSADQLAELQKQNELQDQAQKKLIATLNKRVEELEGQAKKLQQERDDIGSTCNDL